MARARGGGSMSGVLDAILARKRAEIARMRREDAGRLPPRGDEVVKKLRRAPGDPLRLVTEIKHRSPSAGPLSRALTPALRARAYEEAGATMVSVLCDAPFFDGSWDDLAEARAAVGGTLVLAKEFVLDEVQLDRARSCGADAILLIVRIVTPDVLARLVAGARARGLEPLVEVANEREVATALEAGATVIGVNARDLDTLAMDTARATRILAAIPETSIPLHLSGLKSPADVRAIAATRAHGALVGEALMREDDPRPLLRAMHAECMGSAGN